MRLMLDLALNNTGAPISLKDVARRQEISDKYLEHSDPNLNLMEKLMRRDLLSWFKKENDGDKEMDRH